MLRRIAHNLLVLLIASALMLTAILNGNVLCMGADGHVAIEAPHRGSHDDEGAPSADPDHGTCTDISAKVDAVIRQSMAVSVDMHWASPVLGLDGAPVSFVLPARPAGVSVAPPNCAAPGASLVGSVVLLI